MIRLRLFHRDDPANQIESRLLNEGDIVLGRGAQADWPVADPERGMSRAHLTVSARDGLLTLRDTSANGVFLGHPRQRVERDRAVPVGRGEAIHFGPYVLIAEEEAGSDPILPDPKPTAHGASPFTGPADPDKDEIAPPKPRDPFGSALKSDPIALDGDPVEVDAWERRKDYQAGDWDPVAPHLRPDHSQMIGTAQEWAEPPAQEHEAGLGFDAPFTSPILREPTKATGAAIQIPSNWDATGGEPEAPATSIGNANPFAEAEVLSPSAVDAQRGDARQQPIASPPVAEPAPPPPVAQVLPPEPDEKPFAPSPFAEAALPPADPVSAMPLTALTDTPTPAAAPPAPPPASSSEPAAAPAMGDGDALFESFCAGARLSPNAFAGEDRALLMERLGAIYRQSILGVADLMNERTTLKNDFRMTRTTIRPQGNNPFKWVPPQRIAVELLRTEDGSGYSTGERALVEALEDVKGHMLCVLAGMRSALSATFDLLAPSETEQRLAGRSFVMPGQRSAAAWNEYVDLFADLRREADDSAEGPINRAFRQAYEDQAQALDGDGRRR